MSGHRPFSALRKRMTPARRARNAEATRRMLADMGLHELRQARERSQQELARVLNVGQPAVAKLERRADVYVSNLRRYIEALGGSLGDHSPVHRRRGEHHEFQRARRAFG
jgi:DNA-binding transcriptional regulator YiaG